MSLRVSPIPPGRFDLSTSPEPRTEEAQEPDAEGIFPVRDV